MDPVEEKLLAEAGSLATDLLLPGCDWVHRRVQRVSYLEPALVQVRLSVDFTPPTDATGAFVPISVVPKWPPLYRFDFRRADGTPVPLLTSSENGVADLALLQGLVQRASANSLDNQSLRAAAEKLALGTDTDLLPAVDAFESALIGDPADEAIERVLDVASMLADATFLWYPISQSDRGRRMIGKVEYLIQSPEPRWSIRLLRSLSWYQGAEYIPLMHVGADANFHAEVEAPPVLTVRSVEPRYYWLSEGSEGESEEDIDRASAEADAVGLRPQQNLEIEGRLAHIYISGRRPMGVDLVVRFAPSRTGVVLAAFFAALLAAGLATAFYDWRDHMVGSNIDAAVAVLILVPALIGYVVIRPSDHPLARRYVSGTQVLALLVSAIPLAMAALLLRFGDSPGDLKTAWLWAMRGSWLVVLLLAISWIGTWLPTQDATPAEH